MGQMCSWSGQSNSKCEHRSFTNNQLYAHKHEQTCDEEVWPREGGLP